MALADRRVGEGGGGPASPLSAGIVSKISCAVASTGYSDVAGLSTNCERTVRVSEDESKCCLLTSFIGECDSFQRPLIDLAYFFLEHLHDLSGALQLN